MEDACGKHGIGACVNSRQEVFDPAGPATCNDRHAHLLANQRNELKVKPVTGAVGVHGVEKDLPRAAARCFYAPGQRVDPGAAPTAVGRHLESALGLRKLATWLPASDIGRQNKHLRTEPRCHLVDHLRSRDRRGVDPHLVGPRPKQPIDVVDRTHTAADGERDEDLFGASAHDVVRRFAVCAAGRHIEKGQLISALFLIPCRQFDRVTRICEVDKVDALDHSSRVDVETGDNARSNSHLPIVGVLTFRESRWRSRALCPDLQASFGGSPAPCVRSRTPRIVLPAAIPWRGIGRHGRMSTMDEACRDVEIATDELYAGAEEDLRPLHDAVVELARDLTDEDDIEATSCKGAIMLARSGTPFAALRPGSDRTLEVGLRYPARLPDLLCSAIVTASDGFAGSTHRLHLPTDSLDDDVRDIEPCLAAAYDQAR